jgi:hypothetical protein
LIRVFFFAELFAESSFESSFLSVARFGFFAAGGDSALTGAFFLAAALFFFGADESFLTFLLRFRGSISLFVSCPDSLDGASSSGKSVALLLVDIV